MGFDPWISRAVASAGVVCWGEAIGAAPTPPGEWSGENRSRDECGGASRGSVLLDRPESAMFLGRTNPLLAFGSASGVADEELVRRYADSRDEASFELLVRRHSSTVWRVCRAASRNHHSAEDAFQATFLA